MLGALKDVVFAANLLWTDGKKDLKVVIKLEDLSCFQFGEANISRWLDREELDVTYLLDNGEVIGYEEAKQYGVVEFCLRLLIVPTAHTGASVNVAAHPSTREALKTRLGDNANSPNTPHIVLQAKEASPNGVSSGRAVHALFTRRELPKDGFGIAVIPWLDCTAEGEEEVIMPEGDEVKEATISLMRKSTASALSTTVASMEARIRALLEGKGAPLKHPPHVFPEFAPSADGSAQTRG